MSFAGTNAPADIAKTQANLSGHSSASNSMPSPRATTRLSEAAPSPRHDLDLSLATPLDIDALATSLELPPVQRDAVVADFALYADLRSPSQSSTAPLSPSGASPMSVSSPIPQLTPGRRRTGLLRVMSQ